MLANSPGLRAAGTHIPRGKPGRRRMLRFSGSRGSDAAAHGAQERRDGSGPGADLHAIQTVPSPCGAVPSAWGGGEA